MEIQKQKSCASSVILCGFIKFGVKMHNLLYFSWINFISENFQKECFFKRIFKNFQLKLGLVSTNYSVEKENEARSFLVIYSCHVSEEVMDVCFVLNQSSIKQPILMASTILLKTAQLLFCNEDNCVLVHIFREMLAHNCHSLHSPIKLNHFARFFFLQ